MYLAEKEGYISCIKIFKLLEGFEVEKLDVRSLLTYMGSNNIRNGYIIITSTLSEEAKNLLDKFKDKIELKIIDIDGLQELADKHNMLPENSFYYNKINHEKRKIDKKTVTNNILDIKQISLYIPAAIFFFMTSIWLPQNKLVIYIFYYFIILSIINIMFYIIKKWQKTSK